MGLLSLLAVCVIALTGCGGGPRQDPVAYEHARQMRDPMTVEIVKSWDLIRWGTRVDNPSITHLVELKVIMGPSQFEGETITLPYDDFATGKPPPGPGTEMVMMPAMWVTGRGNAMGRPGIR